MAHLCVRLEPALLPETGFVNMSGHVGPNAAEQVVRAAKHAIRRYAWLGLADTWVGCYEIRGGPFRTRSSSDAGVSASSQRLSMNHVAPDSATAPA